MAALSQWLTRISYEILAGSADEEVTDVIYDSRKAGAHTVFVCMTGSKTDSHAFIRDAAKKGCRSFIVERELAALDLPEDIALNLIRVENARSALAFLSAARFDYPAEKLCLIGLTGTKGKTTTAYMIRDMLTHAGKRAGLIGTNGCEIAGVHYETHNTTPESYELNARFREMLDAGCTHVIMECSSQGFKMHRTDGLLFDYGLFLNLSPDHIGPLEHADFSEYLSCKAKLLAQSRIGIVNADDAHTKEVLAVSALYFANDKEKAAPVNAAGVPALSKLTALYRYGVKEGTGQAVRDGVQDGDGAEEPLDFAADNLYFIADAEFTGTEFRVTGRLEDTVRLPLPGAFNVSNALAAIAVCSLIGLNAEEINAALLHVHVSGRMETVLRLDGLQVIVDYAHNEVSMESLLGTLRAYNPRRLVVVFGSGGNRAKDRRFGMGRAAAKFADFSIFTNDNPRDEAPEDILADIKNAYMEAGGDLKCCTEIPDRREAIYAALRDAKPGDMIAVIGKGHEDYQEIKGVRTHFSDREEILAAAHRLGICGR